MSKLYAVLFALFLMPLNTLAFEPVMDQQGMFYFNMTFDAGQTTKTEHHFGFRLDRGLVKPGENMTMSQLADKPAVFNLQLNNNGLKAFKLNGIDYSYDDYVYHGAEGGKTTSESAETAAKTAEAETTEVEPTQPVEESQLSKAIDNIPLGVLVGAIIGIVAVAGTGD